ncbi:MAG: hypothetical protein P8Z00_24390 [Anaerolineales bacterium]|jgi:protein-S-isoprenylcysteine O-methyltransferase Ste14
MDREAIFRTLFILAFIAMMVVRFYYQLKVSREKKEIEIEEKVLEELFGQKYIEYQMRTGRLLPRIK